MRYIKGKNLNLLTVFAALWRERNVTKAAKAIGMTQPALSRALARLRVEFGDPLFVRVARGVSPTDRAAEIAESVIESLESLEHAYSSKSAFDPKTVQKVITIATNDYFEVVAASRLIPKLIAEAPGVTINFRTVFGAIPKEAMEKGEVDLVISGIYEQLPEGFYHQALLTDPYRSAVRKDHPLASINLNNFADLSHVLVTPKGDLGGIVDIALAKAKKKRRISVGLPNFLSAGWMVAHTDLILSAPGLIIENLKLFIPLRDFPTPVPLPHLELFQVWHARTHHDPIYKWLRQLISKSCKKD